MKHHLLFALATLFILLSASSSIADIVAAVTDGGPPRVKIFRGHNARVNVRPYKLTVTQGLRVSTGDVNGDGTFDAVLSVGIKGVPHSIVLDGVTGQVYRTLRPFGEHFNGLSNAAADVNGDGRADLIYGTESGLAAIRIVSATTSALTGDTILGGFLPYGIDGRESVRVAVGDVNGDGLKDIITGQSFGGCEVKVFNSTTFQEIRSFNAFDVNYFGGITVAAGDVNGDGTDDIIVGAGVRFITERPDPIYPGPKVRVFDGASGTMLSEFFAYQNFQKTVFVAAGDLNGDGKAEIVTGQAKKKGPEVRTFNALTGEKLDSFRPFGKEFKGGVVVGVIP